MNENDRNKTESKMYPGLDFLLKMNSVIKLMDSGKRGTRIRSFTGDTSNAIYWDLHAMVYITKKLLDVGFDFVLPGKRWSPIVQRDSLILTTVPQAANISSLASRSSIV